ncbi:hypothetical protein STREPTOSP366_00600 [Streptomyces variabilis]
MCPSGGRSTLQAGVSAASEARTAESGEAPQDTSPRQAQANAAAVQARRAG